MANTLLQEVLISIMKTVKMSVAHFKNRSLWLPPAHLMLFLHWSCKLVPMERHTLVKTQPNKYTVRPHTIYSRPTKLQSKHRLPSNSASGKLCCNLICIQKKIDGCLKNIYLVMFTHTHMHTSSHMNIHSHTFDTPQMIRRMFSAWLSMQDKNAETRFKNNESI